MSAQPDVTESFGRRRLDVALAAVGWTLLFVFVLVTVAPGLLPGTTFLGTDLMSRLAPWSNAADSTVVVNGGIGDTIDQYASAAQLVVEATRAGSFPQWDPFNSGGAILGALPNTAMLSPLSLPWWILPASSAPAGVKILEIACSALGMQFLLRNRWHLPRFTAPLATIVFVSSGFMIAWTNWPQTRVAAFIPLFFWATDRLAVERRWIDVVPAGLITASMFLGGFPAVTGYTIYAAIAYFVVRSVAIRSGWRIALLNLVRAALGVLLGLALSAVQMLPFVWFSQRYVDFESRSSSLGSHLPSSSLSSTLVPFLQGLPDFTHYTWDVHFVEGFSYIGVASLVPILAAVLVRPRTPFVRAVMPFFVALTIICGAAMYFGGPALTALQLLPGVGTSPIGRVRSVAGFAAAVVVAFGAAALFEPVGIGQQFRATTRSHWPTVMIDWVVRIAAALVITIPILIQVRRSVDPSTFDFGTKWILVTACVLGVVAVAGLCVWITPAPSTSVFALLILIVATSGSATYVAHRYWPLSDSSTFYADSPTHEFLRENLGEDRYATVNQTMLPGSSTAYELRSVTGHGFTSAEWQDLLRAAVPGIFRTPTYTTLAEDDVVNAGRNSILDRLGVKYLVQASTSPIPGNLEDGPQAVNEHVMGASSPGIDTTSFVGPARGVTLEVLAQEGLPESPATLSVIAVDDSTGEQLASTISRITGVASDQPVALDLDDIPDDTQWHLTISLSGTTGTITLATTDSADAVVKPVRPRTDNLNVVHTGDSTIIERTTALERIRWATQSEVISDPDGQIEALMDTSTPTDSVILEHSEDARDTDEQAVADLTVTDENTNSSDISVTTTGAGWVVIEDALQDNGWSAEVDGKPAQLVPADHAGVAVYVQSAGSHTVTLKYEAPYFRLGSVISALSVLLVVSSLLFHRFRLRRRVTPVNAPDEPETLP